MVDKRVTVCITSYNRFDALSKTIDSFLEFNSYPIEEIIVIEDSTNIKMKEKVLKKYGNVINFIFNEKNIGQVKSIDKIYSLVKTPYIFHIEDDYIFYKSQFIEHSLVILENCLNIHQVWIRGHMLKPDQQPYFLESEIKQVEDVRFKMVKSPNLGDWTGFSFNAGLRRLSDYKNMFPQGYGAFHNYDNSYLSEFNCNQQAAKFNYRACQLLTGYCDTGFIESTYK